MLSIPRCTALLSGRLVFAGLSRRISPVLRTCCSTSTSSSACTTSNSSSSSSSAARQNFTEKVKSGPSLADFLTSASPAEAGDLYKLGDVEEVPYLSPEDIAGNGRKVCFEVYGCQMNVNDTEIAWGIMKEAGYLRVQDPTKADVILIVTCAIREKAEKKIWNRLDVVSIAKTHRNKGNAYKKNVKVGLLGCMAERLKKEVLEKRKVVDVVAGPDAYRDLPRLLAVAGGGQRAINVQLSLEETYADVTPVRHDPGRKDAFISIMRGCDNMCSYCIVPFTRGRERSRDIKSIVGEARHLADQGVKEIVLLGQNVNSYRDTSAESMAAYGARLDPTQNSEGFQTIYHNKEGGLRFAELLHEVAQVDKEIRVGFTSPHPKDFPDELLDVINESDNVFKYVHIPAQSGSTRVLELMRRGHTRESYLDLIRHIRRKIKDVALSSDYIVGFCGETHQDHLDTLSLVEEVGYEMAFLFAYSMRKKTHAYHRMSDDVPADVKGQRLRELMDLFNRRAVEQRSLNVGLDELVLIEKDSSKSSDSWCGRDNRFMRHVFPKTPVPCSITGAESVELKIGDYVRVQSHDTTLKVYLSTALQRTTVRHFWEQQRQTASPIGHVASS